MKIWWKSDFLPRNWQGKRVLPILSCRIVFFLSKSSNDLTVINLNWQFQHPFNKKTLPTVFTFYCEPPTTNPVASQWYKSEYAFSGWIGWGGGGRGASVKSHVVGRVMVVNPRPCMIGPCMPPIGSSTVKRSQTLKVKKSDIRLNKADTRWRKSDIRK